MKSMASLLLAVLFMGAFQTAGAVATPVAAAPLDPIVTFRLNVVGVVSPAMTFWIAYGPLGGHFAITRLRRSSIGVYSVSIRLPPGRSSFAYVAGHGVTRDRSGPVPGIPVITIRRIDHSTARQAAKRIVWWHVPVG